MKSFIKNNCILRGIVLSLYWFFTDYCNNHVVSHIPFWVIRRFFYRLCGANIGCKTQIDMNCTVLGLGGLKIGNNCHISRQCVIDARGSIIVCNNVSISHRVVIMTGSHNYNSRDFAFLATKIQIDDNVWIGVNVTIVGNVHIKEGAVICAGSVVTKDVEPYSVVAGIPAKEIKKRSHDLDYTILKDIYNFPTFS